MDRPIPHRRQAGGGRQSRKGATVAPERHPLPNCKQTSLLTKTSWDSGRLTSAGRVAARDQLPRRDTQHTWEHGTDTHPLLPIKSSGGDRAVNKSQPSTGGDCAHQEPGHPSCSDLGRAQNAGPTKSAPLWSSREPEPERLRPGKCMQRGTTSNCSLQSNLEPEQCRLGKQTRYEWGQTQCGQDTGSTPQHASDICLQCSSLPTAQVSLE